MAYDKLKGKEFERKNDNRESLKIDEDAELSVDLYNNYRSNRATWEQTFQESKDFINNLQWKPSDKKVLDDRGQPAIVHNILFPARQQAVAMLTSNKPRFNVTAREDSDTGTATAFSDIMSYIWDLSYGNTELKQIVCDYYDGGMGVFIAYWNQNLDYGKGEICLKSLDPKTVYFDPNSRDRFCSDSAHILVVEEKSFEQLQDLYPELTDKLKKASTSAPMVGSTSGRVALEGQEFNVRDQYSDSYLLVDRYSKIKVPFYSILDMDTGQESIVDSKSFEEFKAQTAFQINSKAGLEFEFKNQAKLDYLSQLFEQTGGTYHLEQDPNTGESVISPGQETPQSIPQSTVVIEKTTVGGLIEKEIIVARKFLQDRIQRVLSIDNDMVLYKQILPLENYPIVPFMNNWNRNPYPMSDIQICRNIQEKINFTESQITNYIANTANLKVLLPEGNTRLNEIKESLQRPGTSVVTYNPEYGEPKFWNPPPLPNQLLESLQLDKAQIYEQLGIYPLSQGDASNAPTTVRGTLIIDENGQRRIKSKKDDIESALNVLGKVVIELIQTRYTRHKIIRLLQPDQTSTQTEINKPKQYVNDFLEKYNDVTVGRYDAKVLSGSTMPSNRFAQFDYLMQMLDKGFPVQEEILKKSEIPNIQEILDRMDVIKQQQQAIEQLQNELKKVNGDLQTAQRESVSANKQVEVAKFSAELDKVKNRTDQAATLYEKLLKADLKNSDTAKA